MMANIYWIMAMFFEAKCIAFGAVMPAQLGFNFINLHTSCGLYSFSLSGFLM